MTSLNTIIEEEKKALDASNCKAGDSHVGIFNAVTHCQMAITTEEMILSRRELFEEVKAFLTSAMQRAVENERARIRESFDDWFKNGTEDVEEWAGRVIK